MIKKMTIIINLSKHKLSNEEKNNFNKGLRFTPGPLVAILMNLKVTFMKRLVEYINGIEDDDISLGRSRSKFVHQENMSVCLIPPYTPLLYSKTGVYRGIHYFLIFALKHILWVLVRTASMRRF